MKRSLIWRALLLVVVFAMAVVSLFPIQDKDYMATFENLAAPNLLALKTKSEAAEKAAKDIQGKLDAVTDKSSAAATKLQGEKARRETEAKESSQVVKDYDTMVADMRKRMAADSKVGPYGALKMAARGDENRGRFLLNQVVPVPGAPTANNETVLSYVRRKAAGNFRLGLDLRGGTEFVIGFDAKSVPEGRTPEDVRDQILEILRNRVDALGVAEPEVKPVGPTSISIRMPSVREDDKAEIRKLLEAAAKLEFHLVHPRNDELVSQYRASGKAEVEPGYIFKEMENEHEGKVTLEPLFIRRLPEAVRGEDLERAFPTFNQFGSYAVSLTFNSTGRKAFADVTTENTGQRLAIVLDGKVYSAPVIREPITGGSAEISGSFSPQEANQLSVVLRCGKLPVSIAIDSEFGTDPTLGTDSIRSGLTAGLIGTAAVVLFMLIYYRVSGILAVLALVANALLLFSGMALMQSTLTLPGIAGIVLGIGMAVDANVLIFERIREELDNKKTIGNAVHSGFDRAFITILDSNLTTLITCFILLWFGSGSVRGFAVTLAISLVANMFTAVFMTRLLYDVMLFNGLMKRVTMMRFMTCPNIDFVGMMKPALSLTVIGFVATFGVWFYRGADTLSIDFKGGTQVSFHCPASAPDVAAVRRSLDAVGYKDARVGYKYGGVQGTRLLEVVLRDMGTDEGKTAAERVSGALTKDFKDTSFKLVQTNRVGGLVGEQFQKKAVLAIILSWLAIIAYVSFRFEFAYGVGSVLALVHDVIIACGVCVVFGRQFSLPVLAGILTIIGFSINDTIVIFDRIRENLGLLKGRKYSEIINLSVNQTLSRTIITTMTAMISVLALFLFGGSEVNDFALVMLGGMISGTYSTVFIASALISFWHKRIGIVHD